MVILGSLKKKLEAKREERRKYARVLKKQRSKYPPGRLRVARAKPVARSEFERRKRPINIPRISQKTMKKGRDIFPFEGVAAQFDVIPGFYEPTRKRKKKNGGNSWPEYL